MPKQVFVTGGFDDLRSRQIRLLQEAARLGEVTVLLWSDALLHRLTGQPPKFPQPERRYVLEAIRYVNRVVLSVGSRERDLAAEIPNLRADTWVADERLDQPTNRALCQQSGLEYQVLRDVDLEGFPEDAAEPAPLGSARKKVVVTGCYDWFHSGHVRFFEEVSAYGDLYVIVGHDANIRLLKGEGHPLFPQEERRFLVGSIRYVKQALISSGDGWLDADPEIQRLQPHLYAVNEDGDRGGKREYCEKNGLEYLVLKRTPAPGLPRRTSTDLRGF